LVWQIVGVDILSLAYYLHLPSLSTHSLLKHSRNSWVSKE
jgi:hypothetical protein